MIVKDCFDDLMLKILVIATIVSTTVGIADEGIEKGWMEGGTILLAIIIIVVV